MKLGVITAFGGRSVGPNGGRSELPRMCYFGHTSDLIRERSRLPYCGRIPTFMVSVYGYRKGTSAGRCLVSAYQGENYHDENFDRSGRNACLRDRRWRGRPAAPAARL